MKLLKDIKDKEIPKEEKYELREASRAVLFDKEKLVPILFVSRYDYHKLPGGGIEEGEDKIEALIREVKEEVGSEIEIFGEVGKILEFRSKFNLRQTSYCYLGNILSKSDPQFEQGEIDLGFQLMWISLDEAIDKIKKDKPKDYEGIFIQERDLIFLQEAKLILQESIKETEAILADKGLMKAIKQGEKEIDEGKSHDWEDVKKDLFK